ncbi:hypothetical protein Y032_0084g1786 [Ancylostoma ceylanicum]|uniref:Uncharacterized protein n=1 Tax=Ancylostoma ceylanicum TaxID=53326 RepID=A0A016TQU3_9BILA|nr:hypothetical protein Y032_0084g1786 [Ancylostoma ceylanicum]
MPAPKKQREQTRGSNVEPQVPNSPSLQLPDKQSRTCEEVLGRLKSILFEKAPEAIPVLNELIDLLKPCPKAIVDAEKRERSIVIAGLVEADAETKPSQRLIHTEALVTDVLDTLKVESRPEEIYRIGKPEAGKTRLVKVVFSTQQPCLLTLRRARWLRGQKQFKSVYIRKSMTPEQRLKYMQLRREAYERNQREHNGEKVYVVHNEMVVEACEIPFLRGSTTSQN